MKILVVAHPDDEVIWFDLLDFDKIIIVFCDTLKYPGLGERRKVALQNHPFKAKLTCLYFTEPNYKLVKDSSVRATIVKRLTEKLSELLKDATEVFTHNPWGEYSHDDHVIVSDAVLRVVNCPVYCSVATMRKTLVAEKFAKYERIVKKWNLERFLRLKSFYMYYDAWTGFHRYNLSNTEREYLKIK